MQYDLKLRDVPRRCLCGAEYSININHCLMCGSNYTVTIPFPGRPPGISLLKGLPGPILITFEMPSRPPGHHSSVFRLPGRQDITYFEKGLRKLGNHLQKCFYFPSVFYFVFCNSLSLLTVTFIKNRIDHALKHHFNGAAG